VDIPVVVIAIIAALLTSRERAYLIAAAAWAVGVAMVAWGPAHNSNVDTHSFTGFWTPWLILLLICGVIVTGVSALRRRRARRQRLARVQA
jgi:uncharacterized membrane protein YbhN (UPF0104 family)